MERYNFRPILELNNIIASSSFFYRVLKWEDCFEWKLLETSKKLEDLCCYGRIHSLLFHFWFGQWKASLHLSAMFLAAMECQASGCGFKSANWNLFWTRNMQVKRKCTNRMVTQLLNLLQQSEETYVSNNKQ